MKEFLTNLQNWAHYYWRIAENQYLTLSPVNRKIALYTAIGIVIFLFIAVPLLIILASRKKRSHKLQLAQSAALAQSDAETLTIKEEEINHKLREKTAHQDISSVQVTSEQENQTEIDETIETESTPLEIEDGIIYEEAGIIQEEKTSKTNTFNDEIKDKFVLQIKNDLEAEFTNLIKRNFPNKINFKIKVNVDEEIISKGINILEKLSTLEEDTEEFTFSKNYYYAKSIFYYAINDNDKLIDNIKYVIPLFPDEDIFIMQYASFLIQNNEIDQAEKELFKIKEINPSNLDMYLLLGEINFIKNKFHESLEMFKKVILFDPKNPTAYAYKGYILAKNGYISDGKKDIKKAIKLDYQSYLPYYFLGNIYQELKFYEKAVDMYNKSNKFNCPFIDLLEKFGYCLMLLKKYDTIIEEMFTLYKENRLTQGSLIILASAFEKKENYSRSIEILEYTSKKYDDNEIKNSLGRLHEKIEDFEKSIEFYKNSMDEKNEIETHLTIADIYFLKLEDINQAETYYKLVLNKDKNNYKAVHNLTHIYYKKNDFKNCISHYEQTINHPKFKIAPDMYYEAGIAFTKLEKFDEAIKHLTKAEHTGYVDEELFKSLGYSYLKENKIHKSIDAFKKSLAINPHNPVIHNNIGVIYAQQEHYNDAIKEFKMALKCDKENKEALHNLHKAYRVLSQKESSEYLSQLEEVI